ncbi:MAG TPA: peptide deformylase [Halanaerobiales bacterium]|nr:peptide deformylase [Halanaerobiales bacterium]
MAELPVRTVGDPVLRTSAKEVKKISSKTKKMLDNMAETMYNAPGVGLAAPQVGVLQRVIIVDVDDEKGLIELINPEIINLSEEKVIMEEGCLSVPGKTGQVLRPKRVLVRGLNRNGKAVEIKADNLLARALQHEIDHLNGILFIDKIMDLEV